MQGKNRYANGNGKSNGVAGGPEEMATMDQLWAYDVGSVFGVPIRVHFTYFFLLQLEVYSAIFSYFSIKFTLFIFVLYGPILFGILLMHELGRAAMTKRLGGSVESILLWPLGGFSVCGNTNGGPSDDLHVALAGPLTHIFQGGFWLAIFSAFRGEFHQWTDAVDLAKLMDEGFFFFIASLAAQATMMNAFLFGINLLIPAYPMDGGRILSTMLVIGGIKVSEAAKVTTIIGISIGTILLLQGILYCILGKSTSYGIMIAVIGAFTINSSVALLRMLTRGVVNQHPLFSRECYRVVVPPHADAVALAEVELT